MPITIVLADDHPVVRLGIRQVLEREADFAIVAEVDDALQVAAVVERLQPNVLVLDLVMPSLNGLEITRQVAQRTPKTRIVILSMHANEAYVVEAFRNGAGAYVLKGAAPRELIRAIRDVIAERRYVSPPLTDRAIEMYAERAAGTPLDAYETLSTREREVLHLAAEGHTNADIATRLCISVRTVETHRAHLMHKLNLRNQSELIRYALRRGILALEG